MILALCPDLSAFAEDKALQDRLKLVEEELRQHRETIKQYQDQERKEGTVERREPATPAGQYPVSVGSMSDIKVERPGEEKVPLSFGATGSGRLVYAKPFVSAPKAIVGGYADIQYRSQQKASIENG